MCGRYQFDAGIDEQEIRDILQEIQKKYSETKPDSDLKVGEIFPTNTVPIVSEGGAELMGWGFPMHGRSQVVINTRSETAFEKPMFRSALLSRRVVVPTTGFFEWAHQGGKAKDKYIFRLPSDNMLYLAGIYTKFVLPTGTENRFTILTTEANESMAPYHNRMPVYVDVNERETWIDDNRATEDILRRQQPQLLAQKVDKPFDQLQMIF